ncbi:MULTISPECIES: hypothetical protein [unclassified Variovorax]|uniref:hypothetical protein n=1 Tax=unclassified Variovorax TaxID=663243 RepID=UPI00076DD48B|nr:MULTISPECIES: hypothetical protein [unclassified Variovorax]KWT82050.1 hypothetical protein APY03_4990 [Variovorax sp. WDL1]PNG48752.1 hypothetical protein CHC06_06713 [Variovorax sp. B2]PNG49653.1 hypothetical protein CHC07_06562 [Variovorax sp. B4]VTV18666.1 hypothetical protein WDL1P2_00334 [Variovorax sp. WDL1]
MISERKSLVWGQAAVVEHLEKLLVAAKAGELDDVVMAHRVFKSDGTFEDIVFGGTEEQREPALAKLSATDD